MSDTKQISPPTPYASSGDFCRIFREDMDGLYVLSFLLTADQGKAEQCFVAGLEDSAEGSLVFKEWARSWARRSIIQNAIRFIQPTPNGQGLQRFAPVDAAAKMPPAEQQAEMAAVLALDPFERFVYVMTVLERYSDHECSVLLGCGRRDVLAARIRALQQMGDAAQSHNRQLQNASSESEPQRSMLQLLIAPPLATSA
jgi:hypothetical protein